MSNYKAHSAIVLARGAMFFYRLISNIKFHKIKKISKDEHCAFQSSNVADI